MENKLLSVILPVYNCEKYLGKAIESILEQSYKNFELIIINDGSKDKSLDVIMKYKKLDSRIVLINRENKGLISSLNDGIDISKGEYLVRMDQDDISLQNRIEIQLKYMLENNLDICGGNYTLIDEKDKEIGFCYVPQTKEEILVTMSSNVPFAHPSVMIKKEFLIKKSLKYGINGNRHAEDLDLWVNMYEKGAKFGNTSMNLMKYRILTSSLSRINHKRIKKESNIAFDRLVKLNKSKFESAFLLLSDNKLTKTMQLNLVRASLRYFFIFFDIKLLINSLKKVSTKNIIIGILSFIKLRVL